MVWICWLMHDTFESANWKLEKIPKNFLINRQSFRLTAIAKFFESLKAQQLASSNICLISNYRQWIGERYREKQRKRDGGREKAIHNSLKQANGYQTNQVLVISHDLRWSSSHQWISNQKTDNKCSQTAHAPWWMCVHGCFGNEKTIFFPRPSCRMIKTLMWLPVFIHKP